MTRITLIFAALFLFGASMLSVLGYTPTHHLNTLSPPGSLVSCTVKVVYDGDTLGCDMNGDGRVTTQGEHVRLIGIDATEMSYSPKNHTGKDEPYAAEAKYFVSHNTYNQKIYLEFDDKRIDKYSRTLAYAYLDPQRKQMLNEMLLSQGLARVFFLQDNRRYFSEFQHLEGEAQQNHLNLWESGG